MIHCITNELHRRYCFRDADTIVLMLWLTTVRLPQENLLELRLPCATQEAYMHGVHVALLEQQRPGVDMASAGRFLETLAENGVVFLREDG